jgi:MYXO-CTERM domain-containing protein
MTRPEHIPEPASAPLGLGGLASLLLLIRRREAESPHLETLTHPHGAASPCGRFLTGIDRLIQSQVPLPLRVELAQVFKGSTNLEGVATQLLRTSRSSDYLSLHCSRDGDAQGGERCTHS